LAGSEPDSGCSGYEDDRTDQPSWSQEKGAQSKEQPIQAAKIRSASARATRDHDLMLQQEILRQEGFGSSGPEKDAQAARQLKKEEEDMPHPGSLPQSSASASGQPDFLNSPFCEFAPHTQRKAQSA
jgi:hypothetical protein